MNSLPLSHKTALVTGASSGIGVSLARELASRGANVILTARREESLRAVAAQIEADFGVSARAQPADLGDPAARTALYERLAGEGVQVDVLVNNAGFGLYGAFADLPWERLSAMLELDIAALTHLTHLFLGDMRSRRSGYILLVASIGAYQPSPLYAAYSAAKAYVLSLGGALHYELRGTGVGITVLSPGVTATGFFEAAGQGQSLSLYQRLTMMKSGDVARIGVDALLRKRASVVPGALNAFLAFGTRLIPRQMQAAVAGRLIRQPE